MLSSKRPVSRLGLAVIAALLSLGTATTMATADPTSPPSEPPPSSESSPPSEPSTPPSSEPSTPPSSEPSTPPEESGEKATTKDVTVTAVFGKPSYDTGEDMTISLALKNTGAEDIKVSANFPARWNVPNAIHVTATTTFKEYQELTIAAGETVTNVLTGSVVDPDATSGKLSVSVSGPGGPVESTFTVPVNKKLATVTGRVFHDRNGNGQQDRGEGVNARLEWDNKVNNNYEPSVTAGTDGAFSIELVPGPYRVRGSSGYYLVTPQDVTVPASGVDDLVFEARPSLRQLEVSMAFTKDSYEPTEAPSVRVTLTNNNSLPVSEVVADCYHGTEWPNLTGTGAGWGDLAAGGVTVPGKSTKVVTVTEPMPATAENYGFVAVDCVFAYAELTGDLDNPRASAEAAVPGKTGDLHGSISAAQGAAVGGWRVALTGKDGKCPIVAETKTDERGSFTLKNVPVGQYEVYVVPPTTKWLFKGTNHKPVTVVAGRHNQVTFIAFTSDNDTPWPAPPSCGDGGGGGPGTTPPAPQGSPNPGLAYTGASMLVPGAIGLLALLAGVGAVLVTRRRRAG